MSKVLAVAKSEFLNGVLSKAFLVGIVLMPVLMLGMLFVQKMSEDAIDLAPRVLAVLDRSGKLEEPLRASNAERDESGVWEIDEDTGEPALDEQGQRVQIEPRFELEFVPVGDDPAGQVADLSARVRSGELFGVLEIGPDVFATGYGEGTELVYYTETPSYGELPSWAGATVNRELHRVRFDGAGLDQRLVSELLADRWVQKKGLAGRTATGEVEEAEDENKIRDQLIPAVMAVLLYMLIMMIAPASLNAVLEEKMQRISEVLVSSVSPFELMLGKTLGGVGVSLVLAVLYLGGGVFALERFDHMADLQPSLLLWFVLFQVMAMMMFQALFSAIGAASSEIRDAQSLMGPVMMLAVMPMFFWPVVMEDPNGPVSTAVSLFPPATPILMLLRLGMPPGPPAWQVAASVVGCLAFTIFCVWAGAKVFRIGLLSQGQAPTLPKLVGWIFSKS